VDKQQEATFHHIKSVKCHHWSQPDR